jgi:hypothetical protein
VEEHVLVSCIIMFHSLSGNISLVSMQVIPAENLVAAFDGMPGRLFAIADSVSDAIVSFEVGKFGSFHVKRVEIPKP